MSGVARLLSASGKKVSGSDAKESETTRQLQTEGIDVKIGHNGSNIPADSDLVVYSPAVDEDNIERQAAKSRGIKQLSHFEFIGELSSEYETIAIAGTNGKSTTTALVGLLLEAGGLDPTVIVGAEVVSWKSNIRLGKSDLLVVEADEFDRKFLLLHPKTIVVTNIETDHLDTYGNLNAVREAFSQFAKLAPSSPEGKIFYNSDDDVSKSVFGAHKFAAHPHPYGIESGYLHLGGNEVKARSQIITASYLKKKLKYSLPLPGKHNIYNSLAAASVALSKGVSMDVLTRVFADYKGLHRRFEILGKSGRAAVISDYGHHPTAIRLTMAGAREFYPNQKIMLIFQPHQPHRTKALFDEFVESLVDAMPDELVLVEIFNPKGRSSEDEKVSSLDLVEKISKRFSNVRYLPNLEKAFEYVQGKTSEYDVILCMGAGDIHEMAEKLVSSK